MTSFMLDFKEAGDGQAAKWPVRSQSHPRRKNGWVLATVIALGVIAPLIPASSYAQKACGLAAQAVCALPTRLSDYRRPASQTIINQSQTNIYINNNIHLSNVGNVYGPSYVRPHYSQSTLPSYNGGFGRY